MATGSGAKSGSTRKRSSSGGRAAGAGARKRTQSKPLIIDVEADKATSSSSQPSSTKTSAPSASTGGLDEATAQAAGLSAEPATKSDTASAASPAKSSADTEATSSPSSDSTDTPVVPPSAEPTGREPSAFFLFAAGLIGALLALVLMFLASIMGLFSLSDGRVDDQAAALAALENRVRTIESQSAAEGEAQAFDPSVLAPLESDLSDLRAQLDDLLQTPVGDSASAVPGDDAVALVEALAPFDARLGAVEDQLQSTLAALSAAEDSGAPAVVTADPSLAASLQSLNEALDGVRADVDDVQANLSALASQQDGVPAEAGARLDALDALLTQSDARVAALDDEIASVTANLETVRDTLDVRLGALASDVTALAEAPVAQAPDRLARLGVALDTLVAARDGGQDVANALAAAQQSAASVDDALSDALAPISGGQVAGSLDRGSLLDAYESAYDAMRAAAPTSEGGGLLGALEDRARQMVTIRAPEGSAVLSSGDDPLDQLDALGQLIAEARFGDAVTLATRLPAAMQQASGGLIDALHARVALDEAIATTRQALMRALQEPDDGAPVTDASGTNSQ